MSVVIMKFFASFDTFCYPAVASLKLAVGPGLEKTELEILGQLLELRLRIFLEYILSDLFPYNHVRSIKMEGTIFVLSFFTYLGWFLQFQAVLQQLFLEGGH